jgi:hypothetical protein
MSTFDGNADWRPSHAQFSHIANRYKWSDEDDEKPEIRALHTQQFNPKTKLSMTSLEVRFQKIEEEGNRTRSAIKEMLDTIKLPSFRKSRSSSDESSPNRSSRSNSTSPTQSPTRSNTCYICGQGGHFA